VGSIDEALSAAGSGGTALSSHALKAGLRLGINASPEPFSNVAISLLEDGLVAGVVALALEEPRIALGIVICLLAGGVGLVLWLRSRILRAWQRLEEYRWRRAP
jgi:hypothetical protein